MKKRNRTSVDDSFQEKQRTGKDYSLSENVLKLSREACFTVAATGFILSAAQDCDAAIVYSGTLNVTLGLNDTQSLDLDGGGYDLRFELDRRFVPGGPYNYAIAQALVNGGIIGAGNAVQNFSASESISGASLINTGYLFWARTFGTLHPGYEFSYSSPGYVGFRLELDGGDKYGWVQIKDIPSNARSYTIVDWAYEDSGNPIKTGETGVVPEPSGLALLACGAAGIYALRKKKTTKRSMPYA